MLSRSVTVLRAPDKRLLGYKGRGFPVSIVGFSERVDMGILHDACRQKDSPPSVVEVRQSEMVLRFEDCDVTYPELEFAEVDAFDLAERCGRHDVHVAISHNCEMRSRNLLERILGQKSEILCSLDTVLYAPSDEDFVTRLERAFLEG